jgi:putative addiction module component (TIGR02574 family)
VSADRPGRADATAVRRRRVPAGLRIARAAGPGVGSLDARLSGGGIKRRGSAIVVGRRSTARYTDNMSGAVKQILEAALKLPPDEREQLVDELAASLHSGFATKEIEASWVAELERRAAEIDSGKAELRDWDEVRDELLAELRDRP